MKGEVFVVYKHVLGACTALFVYALCNSEKNDKRARSKAAGFRRNGKFYDINPRSSPYAAQIRILKVQSDCFFPLGLLDKRSAEALL